jgi:hypothetical protein
MLRPQTRYATTYDGMHVALPVAGSTIGFEDAGEHEPKGIPDRWRVPRVVV